MKNKGLGTGLGALFGSAANVEIPTDFEYVPIQQVEPRQEQPRVVFEREKIDELAQSISEHGVISPLTVRRLDGGYYQIVAGERRWRAARLAGLSEIPVRVVAADDREALELALVENLQREDLSPIEEARGYKALIDDFDMTQDDVSKRVSKSRPAVTNALRLLSLPAEVLELVGSGELVAGSARAIAALESSEKKVLAAKTAVQKGLSVREVEELVKKLGKDKPKRTTSSAAEVDYYLEVQKRLTEALCRRVTVRHNSGRGKVEIEFYDDEDFNTLFETLIDKET